MTATRFFCLWVAFSVGFEAAAQSPAVTADPASVEIIRRAYERDPNHFRAALLTLDRPVRAFHWTQLYPNFLGSQNRQFGIHEVVFAETPKASRLAGIDLPLALHDPRVLSYANALAGSHRKPLLSDWTVGPGMYFAKDPIDSISFGRDNDVEMNGADFTSGNWALVELTLPKGTRLLDSSGKNQKWILELNAAEVDVLKNRYCVGKYVKTLPLCILGLEIVANVMVFIHELWVSPLFQADWNKAYGAFYQGILYPWGEVALNYASADLKLDQIKVYTRAGPATLDDESKQSYCEIKRWLDWRVTKLASEVANAMWPRILNLDLSRWDFCDLSPEEKTEESALEFFKDFYRRQAMPHALRLNGPTS